MNVTTESEKNAMAAEAPRSKAKRTVVKKPKPAKNRDDEAGQGRATGRDQGTAKGG